MPDKKETDPLLENKSHSEKWKKRCSKLLYVIFILPLIGDFDIGKDSKRDVKREVVVLFMIVTAMCLSVLISGVLTESEDNIDLFGLIFFIFVIIVSIMQFVLCVILLTKEKAQNLEESLADSNLMKLKIVFLFLFSCGRSVYCISNIVLYIRCPLSNKVNNVIHIVGLFALILFTVCQCFYLFLRCIRKINCYHSFANFAFASFIVGNILTFAKHSITFHFEDIGNEINSYDCKNQSLEFDKIYQKTIKPMTDPTVFEVSILAILLYGENMSKQVQEVFSERTSDMPDEKVNDDVSTRSTDASSTEGKIQTNGIHTTISDGQECTNKRYPLIVVILAVFASTPLIMGKVLQNNKHEEIKLLVCITKFCLYLALMRALYLFTKKQRLSNDISLSLFDLLLLISAFGSTIYFSLYLISTFYVSDYYFVPKYILNIVTTYLQTVLILKMKDYEPINYKQKYCSLSNILLFCATINFITWSVDTFVEAHFANKHLSTMDVFGERNFLSIRHVLVPLLIYYRFKCFLGFLKCSDVLSICKSSCCQRTEKND